MAKEIKLSVVIPAYNEEKRIGNTLKSVDSYLEQQPYGYEIIVVDNGSNDDTARVVKELQPIVEHSRVIAAHEHGKGGAVQYGILKEAVGEYIMFMDADNATPISEIEKFWPYFKQGYSVAIGSRYLAQSNVTHKQPVYRIILSRLANLLIQALVVWGIHDTQLGFKVFTHEAAKDIFSKITVYGWGFDMEVLTIARLYSYRIKEVPVLWREQGGSHVPLMAYAQSLSDLLKIKWNVISGVYQK